MTLLHPPVAEEGTSPLDRPALRPRLNEPRLVRLCVIGCGMFLIFRLFAVVNTPTWGSDEAAYFREALAFWTRQGDLTLREGLYPYLLQPMFLFGEGYFDAGKLINLLMQLLTLLAVFGAARCVLRRRDAAVATVLTAGLGQHMIAGHLMSESLIFLVYWAALLVWTVAFGRIGDRLAAGAAETAIRSLLLNWRLWLSGAAAGVASLSSPKLLPLFAGAAAAGAATLLVVRGRALAERRTLLALAAAAAVLATGYLVVRLGLIGLMYEGKGLPPGVYNLERYGFNILIQGLSTKPLTIRDMLAVHIASWGAYVCLFVGLSVLALVRAWEERDTRALFLLITGAIALLGITALGLLLVVMEGEYTPVTGTAIYRYFYFGMPIVFIGGLYAPRVLEMRGKVVVATPVALAAFCSAYVFFFMSNPRITEFTWISNADNWGAANYPLLRTARLWATLALGGLAAAIFFVRVRTFLVLAITFTLAYSALSNWFLADNLRSFSTDRETECGMLRRLHVDDRARIAFVGLHVGLGRRTAMSPPAGTLDDLWSMTTPEAKLVSEMLADPTPARWKAGADRLALKYNYLLLEYVPGVPVAQLNVVERTRSCVLVALRDR